MLPLRRITPTSVRLHQTTTSTATTEYLHTTVLQSTTAVQAGSLTTDATITVTGYIPCLRTIPTTIIGDADTTAMTASITITTTGTTMYAVRHTDTISIARYTITTRSLAVSCTTATLQGSTI